jgi:shikimate dehydrogenase
MSKFGLIGGRLSHSYSTLIHSKFGTYEYDLCETDEEGLIPLLKSDEYDGFNITIPYKEKIMALCDVISDDSRKIGCVNTVLKDSSGRLLGYNTDYFGFRYLLERNKIDVTGKKCIVLGSGGASLTVRTVLTDKEAESITVISRSGKDNYENIKKHSDAEIIVNTTPVGMFPDNGRTLINLDDFPNCTGVVDLIYNPNRTKLILDAMTKSIPCAGGIDMLVAQAKESSELFQNIKIDDQDISIVVDEVKSETMNTILIGMPGAGKTMLGRKMAKRMGRGFVDIDDMIEENEGMSIERIFSEKGEAYFRKVETEMLEKACKRTGLVIATGGGIVKRKVNYNLIKQNGVVVWIKRDLDKLETEGRPLSTSTGVGKLYEERKDAYEYWSDFFIDNNQEMK